MKRPTLAILLTLLALPGAASAAIYTFTGGGFAIQDAEIADPYPATIIVSGIPAGETVVDVDITLTKISHSFIDDVAALIGGPSGLYVTLFDGAGKLGGVVEESWVFDDSAALPIPIDGNTATGSWRPNDEYSSPFPAPVPDELHPVTLASFNGFDPNGTWALYVADFTAGDGGNLEGWMIQITTVPEPGTTVLWAGVAAAGLLRRRRRTA